MNLTPPTRPYFNAWEPQPVRIRREVLCSDVQYMSIADILEAHGAGKDLDTLVLDVERDYQDDTVKIELSERIPEPNPDYEKEMATYKALKAKFEAEMVEYEKQVVAFEKAKQALRDIDDQLEYERLKKKFGGK